MCAPQKRTCAQVYEPGVTGPNVHYDSRDPPLLDSWTVVVLLGEEEVEEQLRSKKNVAQRSCESLLLKVDLYTVVIRAQCVKPIFLRIIIKS